MPKWQVFIRNASLSRIAEVDDWTQLKVTANYNKVGSWELTVPMNSSKAVSLFVSKLRGVQIYRDGVYVASGPIRRVERHKDRTKNELVVGGPDDLTWLYDVIAWPPGPLLAGGTLHAAAWSAYDTRTGVAETVIKAYASANIGANADSTRQIAQWVNAADGLRGSNITGNARFENLLDFLAGLALQGGDLRLVVSNDANANLTFDVVQQTDKTATVVFNEVFGNVDSFDYMQESPTGNFVLAAGTGDLAARTFGTASDATAITKWGRIEYFKDQRNTGVVADLNTAASAEISARVARTDFKIVTTPTPQLQYGRDFKLGDLVACIVDGFRLNNAIRSVEISVDEQGEVVKPVMGPPVNFRGEPLKLMDEVLDIRRRVRGLEGRK